MGIFYVLILRVRNHKLATKMIDYLYIVGGFVGLVFSLSNVDQIVQYYESKLGHEDKIMEEIKEAAKVEVSKCPSPDTSAWRLHVECRQISEILKTADFDL